MELLVSYNYTEDLSNSWKIDFCMVYLVRIGTVFCACCWIVVHLTLILTSGSSMAVLSPLTLISTL